MTSKQSPTPSGIITKDNGERVIPASKRPDGTIRAEQDKLKDMKIQPLDNDQVNIHNNNNKNLITDEHEKLKKLEPFKEELNKLLNEIKEQEGEGKKSGSGKGGRNGKK
ncbi:5585_t:CDS:2 [Entrophospora sp. SA101]|nr:5585_t:CDS:2 [Entrophospora sp. SA101]